MLLFCCYVIEKSQTQPDVVLSENDSGRFESRFVTVHINETPSIMLSGMQNSQLGIWVAHGEGRHCCRHFNRCWRTHHSTFVHTNSDKFFSLPVATKKD